MRNCRFIVVDFWVRGGCERGVLGIGLGGWRIGLGGVWLDRVFFAGLMMGWITAGTACRYKQKATFFLNPQSGVVGQCNLSAQITLQTNVLLATIYVGSDESCRVRPTSLDDLDTRTMQALPFTDHTHVACEHGIGLVW